MLYFHPIGDLFAAVGVSGESKPTPSSQIRDEDLFKATGGDLTISLHGGIDRTVIIGTQEI